MGLTAEGSDRRLGFHLPTMHGTLHLTASTLPHTWICYPSARLSCYPGGIWPKLYLLHRGQKGAGLYASNPSSFSAEASGLSWIPHGSSPQIPADEQSVECISMGLHRRHNTLVYMHICTLALSNTLRLGDSTHVFMYAGSLTSPPLKHSLFDP